MKSPRVPLHPFLAAIYPVLGLAAANPNDLPPPVRLVAPIVLSLIVAALAYLGAGLVSRLPGRRGLLALGVVILFSGYGWLADHLLWLAGPASDTGDEAALPITGAALILAIVGVRRMHGDLAGVTRFLDRATAILLLMPLLWLGWNRLAVARTPPPVLPLEVAVDQARAAAGSPLPDIYLVVLDKYTGSPALLRNYGFDNSPVEDALRSRGFFVPRASRGNYTYTPLSLASMLNWEYVQDFAGFDGREPEEHEIRALVEHNRTWRFLKSRGYRFIFFPTGFPTTFRNRYADLQLPSPAEAMTEFESVWLRTTPIVSLMRLRCLVKDCNRLRFPYVPEPAEKIDWRFEQLQRMPETAGPRFVFAHFLVPHEPYIYDAECRHREPYWPWTDEGREEPKVRQAYVAQIRCVNRKVVTLVDSLLGKSPVPPIILIQADHGHGLFGRDQPPLAGLPPDRVDERAQVFAAYYVPGAPDSLFYDTITPINALRRVLGYEFGVDLPNLPDETYWSGRIPPYDFTALNRQGLARP
jgi:hypothetical protein